MKRGHPIEKPLRAWSPEQVVALMMERIAASDFYILCPDNETTTEQDAKRIAWAAGDVIENRPALSRWHPDWTEAFSSYMAAGADWERDHCRRWFADPILDMFEVASPSLLRRPSGGLKNLSAKY